MNNTQLVWSLARQVAFDYSVSWHTNETLFWAAAALGNLLLAMGEDASERA